LFTQNKMEKELLIDNYDEEEGMVARFLLTKFKCGFCREQKKAIKMPNLKLPINKRIQEKDCMHWERWGVKLEPIMDKFEGSGLEGYPHLFFTKFGIEQGVQLEPAERFLTETYLNKFLEDEFVY